MKLVAKAQSKDKEIANLKKMAEQAADNTEMERDTIRILI